MTDAVPAESLRAELAELRLPKHGPHAFLATLAEYEGKRRDDLE